MSTSNIVAGLIWRLFFHRGRDVSCLLGCLLFAGLLLSLKVSKWYDMGHKAVCQQSVCHKNCCATASNILQKYPIILTHIVWPQDLLSGFYDQAKLVGSFFIQRVSLEVSSFDSLLLGHRGQVTQFQIIKPWPAPAAEDRGSLAHNQKAVSSRTSLAVLQQASQIGSAKMLLSTKQATRLLSDMASKDWVPLPAERTAAWQPAPKCKIRIWIQNSDIVHDHDNLSETSHRNFPEQRNLI